MKTKHFLVLIAAILGVKVISVAVEPMVRKERTIENRGQATPAVAGSPALPVAGDRKIASIQVVQEPNRDWAAVLKEVREKKFNDAAELTGVMNGLLNELASDRRLEGSRVAEISTELRKLEEQKASGLPKTEVAGFSVQLVDSTDPNKGLRVEPKMR